MPNSRFFLTKESRLSRYQYLPRNICVLVLGGTAAIAFIGAAARGVKWMAAYMLGIAGFFSLFVITRKFRLYLLLLSVLALPIHFNFNIIFKETETFHIRGLPISLFDIILAILFVYWIVQLMLKNQKLRFFSGISIPALAYILLAGISIVHSQDEVLAFCLLLRTIRAYLIFLYFANNIRTRNELLMIIGGLVAGIMFQSMVGTLQYFTGETLGMNLLGETEHTLKQSAVGFGIVSRVGGTIGDANTLAMYLNFFLPLVFCCLFTDIARKYRLLCGLVFLAGLLVEIFTFSRGGWIALCVAMSVTLYSILKLRLKSGFKSIVIAAISILLALSIILGLFQNVQKRLFEEDYGTAYSRIPMMHIAYNMIKDNPLTGVGLNNYTRVMNRYDRTREAKSYEFPYPVHNAFLIIAGESGLPALLCFLLILFGVFAKAVRFFAATDQFLYLTGIGFFAGIIAWTLHAQIRMDYVGINTSLWFSMGMVAAVYSLLTGKSSTVVKAASTYSSLNEKKDSALYSNFQL